MDVRSTTVVLRERDLSDVVDLAVRFVGVHARAFGWLALVFVLPAWGVSVLVAQRLEPWAAWPVALALGALCELPFVALASRLVFDRSTTARSAVLVAWSAAPRVLATRLLQGIVVGAAALFFLVPALWAAAAFGFAPEVSLLERASPGAALGRAQRLSQRHLGDAALARGAAAVALVAAAVLGDVAGRSVLESVLEITAPAPIWDEGVSALGLAGFFVAVPLLAVVRFFSYLNVRTLVEGWDVQARFTGLAARLAAEDEPAPLSSRRAA
jgi:hypothetical protein